MAAMGSEHRRLDVLASRESRDEVVQLEHQADFHAAQVVEVSAAPTESMAAHEDRAGVRLLEGREKVEECRFSCPGRAGQHDELACRHLQIDVVEGDGAAVALGDVVHRDRWDRRVERSPTHVAPP